MQSITEKIIEQLISQDWKPNHPDYPPFNFQQKLDLYHYVGDWGKDHCTDVEVLVNYESTKIPFDGFMSIDYELVEYPYGFVMVNYYICDYFEDEWDQLVEESHLPENIFFYDFDDKEWVPLSREERWNLEFGDSIHFYSDEDDLRFEWDIDFHEDEINFE
jgi:hypothetical protein